jgi:hypothetical protein
MPFVEDSNLSIKGNIQIDFLTNSGQGQNHSSVFDVLKEALLIIKNAQTADQYCIFFFTTPC